MTEPTTQSADAVAVPVTADELAASAQTTLTLLDEHAEQFELAQAARELGATLVRTADDDSLWQALAPGRVGELTEAQRLRLEKAALIDWQDILRTVGHHAPPPVELYDATFRRDLNRAMKRDEVNHTDLRNKIRDLGKALQALGVDPDTSRPRLRRYLRWGAKVVGGLAVVASYAAATAGLVYVLPSALAGAAVAMAIPAPVATAFVIELTKKAVLTPVENRIKRVFTGKDEKAAEYAEDQRTVRYFDNISEERLEELLKEWMGLGDRGRETAELRRDTKRFTEDLIRRLYITWEGALGAEWFTAELRGRFGQIRDTALRLRQVLAHPELVRVQRDEVGVLLATIAVDLPVARAALHQDVAPRDPVDDRIAKQHAQQRLSTLLDRLAESSGHHAKSARDQARVNQLAGRGQQPAANGDLTQAAEQAAAEFASQAARARERLQDLQLQS